MLSVAPGVFYVYSCVVNTVRPRGLWQATDPLAKDDRVTTLRFAILLGMTVGASTQADVFLTGKSIGIFVSTTESVPV